VMEGEIAGIRKRLRSQVKAWSTVGQEQESNGGESASRTLSGGAGSMRWDGWPQFF
jgi:hypothetical protein